MYIALELGTGLGAFIAGDIYNNEVEDIPYVFYTCTVPFCRLALSIFWFRLCKESYPKIRMMKITKSLSTFAILIIDPLNREVL